jgi:hypothetical protein
VITESGHDPQAISHLGVGRQKLSVFLLLLWGLLLAHVITDISNHRSVDSFTWLLTLVIPLGSVYWFRRAARWRQEAHRLSAEILARGFDPADLSPPTAPRPPSQSQFRSAAYICIAFGAISLVAWAYSSVTIWSTLRAQRPVDAWSWAGAVVYFLCTVLFLVATPAYFRMSRRDRA